MVVEPAESAPLDDEEVKSAALKTCENEKVLLDVSSSVEERFEDSLDDKPSSEAELSEVDESSPFELSSEEISSEKLSFSEEELSMLTPKLPSDEDVFSSVEEGVILVPP